MLTHWIRFLEEEGRKEGITTSHDHDIEGFGVCFFDV